MSITINDRFVFEEKDIQIVYKRASGPGGQNVNKVSTAAQLRFDTNTPALPEDVRVRLQAQAQNRINEDGFLIINASRFRSQDQNRQDAIDRLAAILQKACEVPAVRQNTKPTQASVNRRLEEKKKRSQQKKQRDRSYNIE